MSCNIIEWKTKKINDLVIPYESLQGLVDEDDIRKSLSKGKIFVTARFSEYGGITGMLRESDEDDECFDLHVMSIGLCGEHSMYAYDDILVNLLEQSTGEYEAIVIWEDGSIQRLTSVIGSVSTEEIEL